MCFAEVGWHLPPQGVVWFKANALSCLRPPKRWSRTITARVRLIGKAPPFNSLLCWNTTDLKQRHFNCSLWADHQPSLARLMQFCSSLSPFPNWDLVFHGPFLLLRIVHIQRAPEVWTLEVAAEVLKRTREPSGPQGCVKDCVRKPPTPKQPLV